MKNKLIFWLSLTIVILLALIMAQSAMGEEAPEYGQCTIFAWMPSRIWFIWQSAPAGVVRFEDTLILTNTRTGQEFVTGSMYAPLYIGDDAFILFEGVDFPAGNWRITNLTCIAAVITPIGITATIQRIVNNMVPTMTDKIPPFVIPSAGCWVINSQRER